MSAAITSPYPRIGPEPAEALSQLMEWCGAMGITRLADITGLDRVGIPVVQAVRPFSLSNAVSQGKGGDLTAAAISAILQSAEAFCAERIERFDIEVASADALAVPPNRFGKHLLNDAPSDWRAGKVAWVSGQDLISGGSQPVPLELVHTAYVVPPLIDEGIFAATTTGLAAGLAEADATVHAILECIERDAIARAHRVHGFFQRFRLDPVTVEDAVVCDLLERLKSEGMLVALWHVPAAAGVPVIWCHLMESGDRGATLLPSAAEGSAASHDPAAAIIHAVYEAAQSRLAAISGARDDITRASYPKYPDRSRIAAHRQLLANGPRTLDFRAIADQALFARGDALNTLLSALGDSAISSVLAVRIDTAPLAGLSVMRVVVPDLEPLLDG